MSNLEKKPKTLKSILASDSMKQRIEEVLGKNAGTFAASLVQIANSNDMLKTAEPTSIIGAAMTAATLNLPLNNSLGQAYIVPFNQKQKDNSYIVKAQFILGYKGLKQLAVRSGQFRSLYAKEVYEGQKVEDDSFLGFKFDWKNKISGKVIGYASFFELVNGFTSTFYMSKEEAESHGKKFSQTYKKGYGLWADDFDKMALKTVSKLHLNGGEAPLSIEMQSAITKDQAAITVEEDGTEELTYVDVSKEEKVEVNHEEERVLALINGAETQEDLDFAKGFSSEKHIDLIKSKQKEINKSKKEK